MQIYPAIDLRNSKCVRLVQGRFDTMTICHEFPLKVARSYQDDGATWLHIVDLDAAKGEKSQTEIIADIIENTSLKIQVGGGIRCDEDICKLFDLGVSRVIIGSMAVLDKALVKKWLNQYGNEKIVLAFDVNIVDGTPVIAIEGWQQKTKTSIYELLDEYEPYNLKYVLCTDIATDGTLKGPNIELYRTLVGKYPNIQFQASGGIGSYQDIEQLVKCSVSGAIVGKALYTKDISMDWLIKMEMITC